MWQESGPWSPGGADVCSAGLKGFLLPMSAKDEEIQTHYYIAMMVKYWEVLFNKH